MNKQNNIKKQINSFDVFIIYSYTFSLKNPQFSISELFNEIKCKKILIKQHSWIFPNLKKDFFLNSLRLFKYLINKIFFINKNLNELNNIKSDYILSFGEKNKKKFSNNDDKKYLDYPSFSIRFYSTLPAKKDLISLNSSFFSDLN